MPLNALTLTVTNGVVGRPFAGALGGKSAGTILRVKEGSAPGFGVTNNVLSSLSMPYENAAVTVIEFDPRTRERNETTFTLNATRAALVSTVAADGSITYTGGGSGAAPTAQTGTASTSGVVYTVQRLLGSTSTLSLVTGSNSNLSINNTTGAISAASAIAVGASQTANVREANNGLAVEYPVTITGVNATPAPTPTPTPSPTLNALSVSPSSATVGTAFTGTISGKTADSTLALAGAGAAGLSLSGTTISGTPTTAGAVDIVETLAGATNSPRTTNGALSVAASGATALLFDGVGTAPLARAFGMPTSTGQSGPIMSVANGTGTPFDVATASEAQAGGANKVVGYYDGAGNLMTLASRLDLVIENGRMIAANNTGSDVAMPLPAATLTALGDATGVSGLAIVDGIVAATPTQRLIFLSSNTNASTNGFLMNRINNTLQFAFRQNNADSATSMTAGGLPNPNKGSSVSLLGIVEYNQGGTRRYRMSRNGARQRDVSATVSTAATLPGAPLAGQFSIPAGARAHGFALFKGALTDAQSEKLDLNTAAVQSAGGYLEQNDGISTWWFNLAERSPDGSRVVFSSSSGEGMFAANQASATTRRLQRIKTLGIKAFNLDAHNNVSFRFLPNGALLAATVGHTFNTSASSTPEQQRVMIYYSADGTVDGFDAGRPIPATGTDPGNYWQWHIVDQNNWLGLHDRNNNEAWNYYRWTDGNPNNFIRCRPLHILNPPTNGGTAQTYNRSTRLNATTIRHYVVQHPSNARNLVYIIDLNVNTGEVTSGANSFGSIFDTSATSAIIDLSNAATVAQLQVAFDPGAGMTCRVMDAVGDDLLVAYGNTDGTAWQHASVIAGVPKLLGLTGAELESSPQPRRYMTPIVRARETTARRYYRAFNDGSTTGVYTFERVDLDGSGNITGRTTLRTAPSGTKMINIAPVVNATEDFATVLYEGAYSGYDSNRSGATPFSATGAA